MPKVTSIIDIEEEYPVLTTILLRDSNDNPTRIQSDYGFMILQSDLERDVNGDYTGNTTVTVVG